MNHVARSGRGGGVCVIYQKGFSVKLTPQCMFTTFENIDLIITSGAVSVRLVTIYRPPPKKSHTNSMFFD